MFQNRLPALAAIRPACRVAAQRGYVLLLVLLFIGAIGMMLLLYQLGNSRDARYQTYYALGQEFALIARATHTYVQDHAYYMPYIDGAGLEQIPRLNYYKSQMAKIEAFLEPLGSPDNVGNNVLTFDEMQQNGVVYGGMDTSFNFTKPLRGTLYTFRAHGGLLPLHAPREVQAASALLVMYGRPAGGRPDIRTIADMAAFRSGAASNGLNRIGIVLDPNTNTNIPCGTGTAIVSWGTNPNDCLTAAEASAIGMALDKFDVVAPAWESVERELTTQFIYRRPHPGLQGMNVMQDDLMLNGGAKNHRIVDSSEIYTETVNIDGSTKGANGDKNLYIGNIDVATGQPLATATAPSDAILTVGRGHNTLALYPAPKDGKEKGPNVCPDGITKTPGGGSMTTACFNSAVEIEKDLAVAFKEEEDTDYYPKLEPILDPDGTGDYTILKVDGEVQIATGNVTVSAEEDNDKKGFFDVSGGTGGATFKINKQDASGNGGTVINKKVTVKSFNVAATDNAENFIVDQDLIITGGDVKFGSDSHPSQVVLTQADLKSVSGKIDIDTTGKAAIPNPSGGAPIGNGIYSADMEINALTQTGTSNIEFKSIDFAQGTNSLPVVKTQKVVVDPKGLRTENDCVGKACPDNVVTENDDTEVKDGPL